ncbi:hypothetical protein ACROYT_G011245 [Oculina patagonica]
MTRVPVRSPFSLFSRGGSQIVFPNVGREEVELNNADDIAVEVINSVETENDVVIEKVGNKLVVYAEKTKIIRSVQALREKLGLPQGGARKTRRGQRSTNIGAREQNETSQEDRFPASQAPFLKQLLNNGVELSLHQSDITDEQVDAIVNAANEWLQHGGGVAAAIVRKGGRQIDDESRRIMSQRNRRPLNVGDAVSTRGGNLPCRFVIHTVGPRWNDYDRKKSISLLHIACLESLRLAAQLELCSIALPAISSGIFGMPKTICAQVMFEAVEEFSSSTDAEFSTLRDVRIVIIDDETISFFREEFVKRYTSQETSSTKPTHQERPSTEEQKGSSASNAKVEPPSFSSANELLEEQSKKSGENDDAETPNESVGPDNESGDHHKEVLDRIKEVHPSNKNISSTNKASPPTSIETPDVETEANDTNKEAALKASASVKSSELSNMNTAAKPAFGRGRGVLAANFSGRPHRKPGSKSSEGTQFEEKDKTENANAGRGRGMTHAAGSVSPPGLTVTDEGRLLARKLGKQVNGDLNIDPGESMNENKEEKKESIKEASKEENQEPKHNNQNTSEDRLNDECHQGHSKDQKKSSHSQLDQDAASWTRLSPDGGITESQDTEKESPQISATDNNSKLPKNENKPIQGENETKVSKQELDQSSSDATDDKTTHPKRPLPSNQSETSYVTKEVTPTASYESVNDRDTMKERPTGEYRIARQDGVPPYEMQRTHQQSEPNCAMCTNLSKDPVYPLQCGHFFCKSCWKRFVEKTKTCPNCKQENLFRGNQPVGYMSWRAESHSSLPGYEEFGTLAITFNFDKGIQGSEHPNPGQPYCGFFCTSYLPNSPAGQELCNLLRTAFDSRLIFTIGKCPATGEENKIVWNGIELKINRSGGPANCGYPDPSYLDRAKSQLAEKGITKPHD